MKKTLVGFLLSSVLVLGGTAVMANSEIEQPFAKGELNPYSKFFTGTTHLNRLVTKDDVWNSSIGNVTFDAGAGEGRYQEKGKDIQILKKGDVVKIPPNVEHWHGAAPDSMFAHISIEPNIPHNETTWLEPVTDKEYK